MKKLFILILFFISIKCEAQSWFKLNASQIKIDSLSIIPTTNDELQVDSNWVKLFSGSGGSGEINTASNLGGGLANYDSKLGVDLRFNSFKALDFDLTTNVISLDYTNGQAASSLQNGYLSAGDWSIFNSKQSAITPAALTKADDANVTLTLGGTPTTALLQATSLTLGWAGQLSIARGGTGLGSLGTASQQLRVNAGATALEYFTPSASSGTVTNVTATDNTGQTWTITNPTTTPNLSLALTSAAVGLGNVTNNAQVTSVSGTTNRITSTGGTTPAIDISATLEALLGKVANPLSQFAATTSLEFKGVISDETGAGSVVFANAPAMSSITLAAGTATAGTAPLYFTLTGAALLTVPVAGALNVDAIGIPYYTHATGERGVIDAEQFMTLTGAYTLTSQTGAQKLFNTPTNGQVTLAGSKTYFFECVFSLTGMSASSGNFGFALGGTATYTSVKWQATAIKAVSVTSGNAAASMTDNVVIANTTISGANVQTTGAARIYGMVRINTGGTLIPQVSFTTVAGAVTPIVGIDSYFRIWCVGAGNVVSVGNFN